MTPPPRTARLVLVTPGGDVLGVLPPLPVRTPWWHEAAPVVQAARTAFGAEVVILRLLDSELPAPHGGAVTYVAELGEAPTDRLPLEPWPSALPDDPRRMPWARPGGPSADLAWAERVISAHGLRVADRPEQVRAWNLSSLWRMSLHDGSTAWLKVVPPFFAHEGPLLQVLGDDGAPVPPLLGVEGRRLLLAGVPGRDVHEPDEVTAHRIVTLLVRLQAAWASRVEALLATGAADYRAPALARAIATTVGSPVADRLGRDERHVLDDFVTTLDERLRAVAACGLPDTLVHGDFHPANVRADGTSLVLLDWGDSGVGHPLLDRPAFLERVPAGWARALTAAWSDVWRAAVPGCDPDRSAALLEPIAAARQAVIYDRFVAAVEVAEAAYHRDDVIRWLRHVVGLVRDNRGR